MVGFARATSDPLAWYRGPKFSPRLWKELLPCQRLKASGAEQMAPSAPESAMGRENKEPRIRSHQTACLLKSQRQRQAKLDESPWIYFSATSSPLFTRAFLRATRRPLPPRSHRIRESISSSSSSRADEGHYEENEKGSYFHLEAGHHAGPDP